MSEQMDHNNQTMSEQIDRHNHNCCHKQEVKKGIWSLEEDQKLIDYINAHGAKSWSVIPILAGLRRCGKSCRLRWLNYLKPNLKRGNFNEEESRLIIQLHRVVGNKWARIANYLPGRTDNEVKNYWNSTIKKNMLKIKKRQNSLNNTTTTTTIPYVTIPPPTTTTVVSATIRPGGGGSNIGGESSRRGPYSLAPPPSYDHQGYYPNILQDFASFSNSAANTYQMDYFNANLINPEVLVPTPSMLQNPPLLQPNWISNNNYPFNNFNQISQEEFFVPFILPDITASSSADPKSRGWNLPVYTDIMSSHDSSLMMMANAQKANAVTNNVNDTSILTSGDDGMDFLETIFSPFSPEPSPASSASSFPDEHASALINNPSVFPIYTHMNHDSSLMMMMSNAQEANTVTDNSNNDSSILSLDDEGMDFLDAIFSRLQPEPSPASSASSFLEDQTLINNPSLLSFNYNQFLENPNNNMFGYN